MVCLKLLTYHKIYINSTGSLLYDGLSVVSVFAKWLLKRGCICIKGYDF